MLVTEVNRCGIDQPVVQIDLEMYASLVQKDTELPDYHDKNPMSRGQTKWEGLTLKNPVSPHKTGATSNPEDE